MLLYSSKNALACCLNAFATVAQLVEQRIRNAQAVGSSPTSSSNFEKDLTKFGKVFSHTLSITIILYQTDSQSLGKRFP